MRVVKFRHETEERLGFLVDDQVVDPKRVADQAGEAAYDNAIAFTRGVVFFEPPQEEPWGRSMRAHDPDGYTVEFAEGRRGHRGVT
jgi:hypothetical protein